MDSRVSDFLNVVKQLDTADVYYLLRWMRQLAAPTTQRVWVVETNKTGTGPLVLVGEAAALP